MLDQVWDFLKNPINQKLDVTAQERYQLFSRLLFFTVLCSIILGITTQAITTVFQLDFGNHAVDKLLTDYSPLAILLLAVVIAPLIEELFFRAPLGLFKQNTSFRYAYYCSILLFGLLHITNFQELDGQYWAIPILVSPQLSAGIFLGFIRTKLGLIWSVLLHAAHNLILVCPIVIYLLLDNPIK